MKEIQSSELGNYKGKDVVFEQQSTGKQISIRIGKTEKGIVHGTRFDKELIYYEMVEGGVYNDTKLYVEENLNK